MDAAAEPALPRPVLLDAPLAGLLLRPLRPDDGGSAWSAYTDVLTTGHLLSTVRQSFEIAGLSFALMLLLGFPLAYLIRFRMPPQRGCPC